MASELLTLVKVDLDMKSKTWRGEGAADSKGAPAVRSGVELRALYLLAVEEIQPTSEKGAKLADWLLACAAGFPMGSGQG